MNDSLRDDPQFRRLSWLVKAAIVTTSVNYFLYFLGMGLSGNRLFVTILLYVVLLGLNIVLLLKVLALKNWARRLFILLFIFFYIPFIPAMIAASPGGSFYPGNPPIGLFQKLTTLVDIVVAACLIHHLLKEKTRRFFITTPSKTYQQVLLMLSAALFFLVGMVTVPLYWIVRDGIEAKVKKEAKEVEERWIEEMEEMETQKEAAAAVLGTSFPERDALVSTINREQFDVISFGDFETNISFVLFVLKPGSELSLEEMLIALEFAEELDTTIQWAKLMPAEVLGSEQLVLTSGEATAQRVRFKKGGRALLVSLEINGKRTIVVAHKLFHKNVAVEEVERFLNELLVSSE